METWRKTLHLEELLGKEASSEELLASARIDGFDTVLEFGLKMVINGMTTVDEVNRTMAS